MPKQEEHLQYVFQDVAKPKRQNIVWKNANWGCCWMMPKRSRNFTCYYPLKMEFNIKTILGYIKEITEAPKGLQDVTSYDIQRATVYSAELGSKKEDKWKL